MRRKEPAVLTLLLLSAVALALAPLNVDDSYSVIKQTLSESAGQGVKGAWVARSGFLLLGGAVVWLTILSRERWGLAASVLLGTFGFLMVSIAAISSKSWVEIA
jgi:hypothetical protein